jgi:signal transduction histidine kinase
LPRGAVRSGVRKPVRSGPHATRRPDRVADTGPGIPPEAQAAIFEPFYRFPPDRRYPQGLGVGLTIARDMVAAHGGALTVESEAGAGAAFTVLLPLK